MKVIRPTGSTTVGDRRGSRPRISIVGHAPPEIKLSAR